MALVYVNDVIVVLFHIYHVDEDGLYLLLTEFPHISHAIRLIHQVLLERFKTSNTLTAQRIKVP